MYGPELKADECSSVMPHTLWLKLSLAADVRVPASEQWFAPRHQRHVRIGHDALGPVLVAHRQDGRRRRPDERHARGGARRRELVVLRQEAVAGVNGCGACALCSLHSRRGRTGTKTTGMVTYAKTSGLPWPACYAITAAYDMTLD